MTALAAMKLAPPVIEHTCPEREIYNRCLPLDGTRILELGCGRAELTRLVATHGVNRHVTALEVDELQHALNLKISDLPNVEFKLAGAQSIPTSDSSFDIAMMFKSLHHVPQELMPAALHEISRVLKPGGFLYVSEPIFAGEFNEILRLFHDEERVRSAAFDAIRQSVAAGVFELVDQIFFNAPIKFQDFSEYERMVIGVTHTRHHLTPEVYQAVKTRFEHHQTSNGVHFAMPMRVDLLRKPWLSAV